MSDPNPVGQLLQKMRVKAGYTQRDMAIALAVSERAVYLWESQGKQRASIPGKVLIQIKNMPGFEGDDYKHLILIRFPALDLDWLSDQSAHEQAGLLLKACRQRFGWSGEEFAKKTRIPIGTLRPMEAGYQPIADNMIGKIIRCFDKENNALLIRDRWFDSKMHQRFKAACALSNPLTREKHNEELRQARLKLKEKSEVKLGAVIKSRQAKTQLNSEKPDQQTAWGR